MSLSLSALLVACSSPSGITTQSRDFKSPTQWSNVHLNAKETEQLDNSIVAVDDWLRNFEDIKLIRLTEKSLSKNFQLKASAIDVAIAEQRLNISESTDWPALDLAFSGQRRKSIVSGNELYTTDYDLSLNLSYELDLWGKLSDQQQQDQLDYLAANLRYEDDKNNLVASVASAWFNLQEAQQLALLFEERARNLEHNLELIQASYRLGLNQALDIYLSQNDVSRELARVEEQRQKVLENKRSLEILLGDFPSSAITAPSELPRINSKIATGLPSDLLTRRKDIQALWYELLALDAGLAVAHKQRFPRIALSASTGTSAPDLSDLLDADALAWSLLGNVTTPLFDAGRLSSLEETARLQVVKQEQNYLLAVHNAFAEVENAISNRAALLSRYHYFVDARENALEAESLSFNQYMKGIVSYSAVLESQRRAFDAQTNVIQLTNQLLQNRIQLHIALGGSFEEVAEQSNTAAINQSDTDA